LIEKIATSGIDLNELVLSEEYGTPRKATVLEKGNLIELIF
jgi:hypothetical protein